MDNSECMDVKLYSDNMDVKHDTVITWMQSKSEVPGINTSIKLSTTEFF